MSEQRGLLIACGEPAVAGALDEVARRHFGELPVERILLPGGAWWLAEAADATSGRLKRMVAGRIGAVEAVSAWLADPLIERVIIVGHQDCAWYRERHPGLPAGELIKRLGAAMYAGRDELVRLARRPVRVRGVVLVVGTEGWVERELF